jgi:methylmalonyl-CoA mutase
MEKRAEDLSVQQLLAEFPPVGREAWLEQMAKDLKGRSVDDLNWQAEEGLTVSPFAHADDFETPPAPLSDATGAWEICEILPVADPGEANRHALEALAGGAEGLEFALEQPPKAPHMHSMLSGVYLDFIGLHFSGPGVLQNPGAILAALSGIAAERGLSTQSLRGSLGYDPVSSAALQDWRYLADLIVYAGEQFPGFRVATAGTAVSGAVAQLAALLDAGRRYLENLTKKGLSPQHAAGALQFSIPVGKSYFLEIAKIRAFKLLWLNVLKAWGAPLEYPRIAASFQPAAYTDNLYANMIRATTMAMSAVLGGAQRLTVLPYDVGREAQARYDRAFARRIALNVQHLMKMESYLDQTPDPAAGSYYIEKLTRQLADAAWDRMER